MVATDIVNSESAGQPAAFRRLGVPESVVALMFAPPTQADDDSGSAIGSHPVGPDKYTLLSDDEFAAIAPYLPDAVQAQIPVRTFVDALLFMLNSAPSRSWASIPGRLGGADATRQRYTRLVTKSDALQTLASKIKGSVGSDRQEQIEALSKHATNFAARRSRRSQAGR